MTMRPDPTFHASPKLAMEAPPENFAYTLLLSPDFSKAGRAGGHRRQARVARPTPGRAHGDDAEQGRRVSPLRLERLLVGAVAADRPRLPRAALPDHPRHPLVAHLRRRHEARIRRRPRSTRSSSRRRCSRKTGYSRPHTIHCGPEGIYVSTLGGGGTDGTQGPPGVFIMDCETFDVLGPLGDRSRSADAALRFLVEPAARLHGVERMGAAAAVRERHRAGGPAGQQIRPSPAFLGSCARGATCRPSTSAPITRWRSRCGRRTIRCANTVSSASSSTPPTSKARSGPGGARAANSTSRRRRRSRPSRRRRRQAAAAAAGLRRGAAAGHRHRPVDGRPLPLRRLLGHRRDAPIRRHATRGSRSWPAPCISAASRAARRIRTARLRRRAADGRDQPRRQARLLDQLALLDLGRPVLSRTACRARW